MAKAGEIEYATLAYLAGEKIAAKYLTLNQASETVYDVLNGGRVVDHIVKDGNGWKDSKGHSGASPLEVLDQLTYVAKRNGAMDYKAVAYLAGEEEQPDKEKNRVWRLENLEPEPEDKNASTAYLAGEETEASIETEADWGMPFTFDPQGAEDYRKKWEYFHQHEHDKLPEKDYGPQGPGMTDQEKKDFKRDWDRSKKSVKILAFGAQDSTTMGDKPRPAEIVPGARFWAIGNDTWVTVQKKPDRDGAVYVKTEDGTQGTVSIHSLYKRGG